MDRLGSTLEEENVAKGNENQTVDNTDYIQVDNLNEGSGPPNLNLL